MLPETDIHRAAAKWVERYDKEALTQLTLRLAELHALGAREAFDLWLRIYGETERLIAARRHN